MAVGHVFAEFLLFCGQEFPETLLRPEGPGSLVPTIPSGRWLALHSDLPCCSSPGKVHLALVLRVDPNGKRIHVNPRHHVLSVEQGSPVPARHPGDHHGVPGVEPVERRAYGGRLGVWNHALDGASSPVPLLLPRHRYPHCVLLIGVFDGRFVRSHRTSAAGVEILHIRLSQSRLMSIQQLLHWHFRTTGEAEDSDAWVSPSRGRRRRTSSNGGHHVATPGPIHRTDPIGLPRRQHHGIPYSGEHLVCHFDTLLLQPPDGGLQRGPTRIGHSSSRHRRLVPRNGSHLRRDDHLTPLALQSISLRLQTAHATHVGAWTAPSLASGPASTAASASASASAALFSLLPPCYPGAAPLLAPRLALSSCRSGISTNCRNILVISALASRFVAL
mmetsp:Transcript_5153/g.10670  ORF Transcript_5153/g.10670 Transcript_5153/m.10670 type:complete len:388 (+) Transcript_5153:465-1628(+)